MGARRTAFVFHELYLWHNTGSAACEVPSGLTVEPDAHIESPPAKRRFRNLLEVSGLLEQLHAVKPRAASDDELRRAHDKAYIAQIKKMSDTGGGNAGDDTPFGAGAHEIARLAAGGAVEALSAVCAGDADNAYALVRPPGHHALANRGMGFCIFNNAAVAIRAAQAAGIKRIAHVDWDVHHGNGTQDIFYNDNSVLTISLHQEGNFPPDSGNANETGEGKGKGCNVNIPLPPGSGHGAYIAAMEQLAIPAMRAHNPDAITVSCGFDAGAMDPLGRMMCHSETFRAMTKMTRTLAEECCNGRLAMFHEGGYFAPFVPYSGLAVVEELSGIRTKIQDPFLDGLKDLPGQELQPHQQVAINEAKKHAAVV